jgi:hypothetical protein
LQRLRPGPIGSRSPTAERSQQKTEQPSGKKYDKRDQHFINLPFVHPDETDKFDALAIRKAVLEPALDSQGEPRHALAALKRALQLLQASDTPPEDKAVSLCWVLHLIGDLHQPLHAAALIGSAAKFTSKKFGPQPFDPPHGDQGANRCAIKVNENDPDALELHSYWDGLQFDDKPDFSMMEGKVLAWLQDPKLRRDQFPELDKAAFLTWAEESLELAKANAYKEGAALLDFIPLPPKHQAADLHGLAAPPLSEAYKRNAEQVAKKRIVLAGYRLADQLTLAPKPSPGA